jgi:polar amino acid transport system substrate-binding protein
LAAAAGDNPSLWVLDGRFMAIEQAMGMRTGRAAGLGYLTRFLETRKVSGFVADALTRSGQADALVAPPSGPGLYFT